MLVLRAGHGVFGHTSAYIKVTPYLPLLPGFSDSEFRLSAYFGVVFPILDRIRTKIVENCQINVKMRTCNLTKIAKSVIFETFFRAGRQKVNW